MLNETPFFLASAPVSALDRAKQLVTSHGGEYAAGDKDDIFNSMTLSSESALNFSSALVLFAIVPITAVARLAITIMISLM